MQFELVWGGNTELVLKYFSKSLLTTAFFLDFATYFYAKQDLNAPSFGLDYTNTEQWTRSGQVT